MGVDHGGFYIGVAEVILDLADVHPLKEQVGSERVAERMDRRQLADSSGLNGLFHSPLHNHVADMMPSDLAASRMGSGSCIPDIRRHWSCDNLLS